MWVLLSQAGRERRAQFCSLCSQKELEGAQGSQQSPAGKLIRGEVPFRTRSPSSPAPPLLGCALWEPQSLAVRVWEGTKAGRGRGRVPLQSWVTVPCPRAELSPFPVLYNKWLLVAVPAFGDTNLLLLILHIQNSCNAWKPSSSADPSPSCHPCIDPHWHHPTSFTRTQMLFLGAGCQNSQTKITLLWQIAEDSHDNSI